MTTLMLKVGDKVRNRFSGHIGIVVLVEVPGMPDCALVRFTPTSDGFCIPRSKLEKILEVRSR